MNKIVKRFKRLLEIEFEKQKAEIKNEAQEYLMVNIENCFNEAAALIDSGKITDFEQVNDLAFNMVADMHKSFVVEKAIDNTEIGKIKYLQLALEEESIYFDEFDVLENYLEKFGYSDDEKIEVYAYYFNSTIKFMISFNPNNYQTEVKAFVKDCINSENAGQKILGTLMFKKLEKHIFDKLEQRQINWGHFRNVINEEGEILPFQYAEDFMWILEDSFENSDYVKLILQKSANKWHLDEEKRRKALEVETERKLTIEQKALAEKEAFNRQKLQLETKRAALHELKGYLIDDTPIKYIASQELLLVLSLLKQAGYSDEHINQIKRTIIENNIDLKSKEKMSKLQFMMSTYLSVEQIEIIEQAKSLVNNPDAIINPIFYKIQDEYNLILEQLLSFYGVDVNDPIYNDDSEILIISIESLNELIINYNYTDYRRILK